MIINNKDDFVIDKLFNNAIFNSKRKIINKYDNVFCFNLTKQTLGGQK